MSDKTVAMKEIVLQRLALGVSLALTKDYNVFMPCEAVLQEMIDRLVVGLKTYVIAGKHETKTVECWQWASWFDHLRADHFPAWVNKRWPPKQDVYYAIQPKNVYVCPHANVNWPETPHIIHLRQAESDPN